jgi:hypothetical protein
MQSRGRFGNGLWRALQESGGGYSLQLKGMRNEQEDESSPARQEADPGEEAQHRKASD